MVFCFLMFPLMYSVILATSCLNFAIFLSSRVSHFGFALFLVLVRGVSLGTFICSLRSRIVYAVQYRIRCMSFKLLIVLSLFRIISLTLIMFLMLFWLVMSLGRCGLVIGFVSLNFSIVSSNLVCTGHIVTGVCS
uniref:Uncharacterized protein n=1 Tax=Cacopsylla melanoneura TaxID=428564 RepID=A0A8D8YT74_9HEMI